MSFDPSSRISIVGLMVMEEAGANQAASTPRKKIEIASKITGKPPRKGVLFPAREKDPGLLPCASAKDLRSVEDVEKETVEAVDEASPRGVLEDGWQSLDSETSSSKACTSFSETRALSNNASLWRGLFRLWRKKSLKRLSSFPPVGFPRLSRWRSSRENQDHEPNCTSVEDYCFFKPSWKTFTISELRNATSNFSQANVIGKGGYAEVYKGCLEDGQLVAIKKLNRGTPDEQTHNFLSELGIIVHINHPNAAKLIGVGVEGGMHLVFQLSPHGSLANLLHGSKEKLDWAVRYKVALGTSEGLEYLHERCQRRIIHRDIKAANILLTEDFEPQICDFGLAKWLPDELTHHTVSCFEGTFGYLAPEYFMHGIVDEKIDVFSFGVLLLELITGRKALDSSQQSLVMWAKPLIEKNDVEELVDPSLGDAYDYKQLKHVAETASLCIQQSSTLRPRMSEVVKLLQGEEGASGAVQACQKPIRRRTYSEELFDAEEYNSTRYLSDLNRHKQLALDFKGITDPVFINKKVSET